MSLQKGVSSAKNSTLIGSRQRVLVDGPSAQHEWLSGGRTWFQAPEIDGMVVLDGHDGPAGEFVEVEVTAATEYDLVARAVEPKEDAS